MEISDKWSYLINQDNNILQEIRESRRAIARDKTFLYASFAAFITFAAFPLKGKPQFVGDMGLAYSLTGLCFVIILVWMTFRHVQLIGHEVRKRAQHFKQLNLTRGQAFKDGFINPDSSVLPLGLDYSEIPAYKHDKRPRFPWRGIGSVRMVPYFYSILIWFLTFAMYYFGAVVWHLVESRAVFGPVPDNGLFTVDSFRSACLAFPFMAYAIIHLQWDACLGFNRDLWEAKAIKPSDPSPIMPLRANWIIELAKWVNRIVITLLIVKWMLDIGGMLSLKVEAVLSDIYVFRLVMGFKAFALLCSLFLVLKIGDIITRMRATKRDSIFKPREKPQPFVEAPGLTAKG